MHFQAGEAVQRADLQMFLQMPAGRIACRRLRCVGPLLGARAQKPRKPMQQTWSSG